MLLLRVVATGISMLSVMALRSSIRWPLRLAVVYARALWMSCDERGRIVVAWAV